MPPPEGQILRKDRKNEYLPIIDCFSISGLIEFGLEVNYEIVAYTDVRLGKKKVVKVPHFIDDLHRIYLAQKTTPSTILPRADLFIVECYRILKHGRATNWRGRSEIPDFLKNIRAGYQRKMWVEEEWAKAPSLFDTSDDLLAALDRVNLCFALATESNDGKFSGEIFCLPAQEASFILCAGTADHVPLGKQ